MSIKGCFRAKISTGRVDERAGRQVLDWLADAEAERLTRLSAAEAAREAATEVADTASRLAARDADLALRSISAQIDLLDRVTSYRGELDALTAAGKAPITLRTGVIPTRLGSTRAPAIGAAIRSMLTRDPNEIATGPNLQYLARDIRGRAHAQFADAIESLRPKKLGLQREHALEHDVLRALYGEADVPEAARAAAESFTRVSEDLRGQFNGAGGVIPERRTWRLPQPHDADKVAAVTRESWKDFVRPLLDRADTVDFETGQPLSDEKLERLLDGVHDTIASRGVTGPPSAAGGGRTMLANTRTDARVLSFKDADAWLRYREAFGTPAGVFDVMMSHISDMAEDIAGLRTFGPNPAGLRRYAESLFDREQAALRGAAETANPAEAAAATREIRRAGSGLRADKQATMHMWDEVTGATRVPVSMELARSLSEVRAGLSAAQLGSAIISSLSDTATLAMTARFNGIPAMDVVRSAVAGMADRTSEISAAQAGLVADTLVHAGHETDRFMGETIRSGVMSRMSGAVIRASGLRRWTASLRNAFGMEMMAHAARLADTAFDALPERFRGAFERYGIDAAHWDAIRRTAAWEPRDGARFIRPDDVGASGHELGAVAGERLARLVNTEIDYAVIESDAVTRNILFGGSRPGTGAGEMRRAIGMYKQFPVTFVTLHFARAFARGWDGGRLTHAAQTLAFMLGLGVVAMQAKQIANGKDPLSLDPSTGVGLRAWGSALFQSGGLGIFGDLVSQDKTRYGNTWAATLGGPLASLGEDVLGRFVLANVGRVVKGEPTQFTGDGLYLLGRYAPGSTLAYTKLAFQRTVMDQLALMLDHKAADRMRRMEDEAAKQWSQRFWWRPGQTAPAAAPNFGAIAGR